MKRFLADDTATKDCVSCSARHGYFTRFWVKRTWKCYIGLLEFLKKEKWGASSFPSSILLFETGVWRLELKYPCQTTRKYIRNVRQQERRCREAWWFHRATLEALGCLPSFRTLSSSGEREIEVYPDSVIVLVLLHTLTYLYKWYRRGRCTGRGAGEAWTGEEKPTVDIPWQMASPTANGPSLGRIPRLQEVRQYR